MSWKFFKFEVERLCGWRALIFTFLVFLLAYEEDFRLFLFFGISIVMLLSDLIFVYLHKWTLMHNQ